MFSATLAYVFSLVLVGAYAFLFLRKDGWRKWVGPLLLVPLAAFSFFATAQALGLPRPLWTLYGQSFTVLAVSYDEPNYIYVWAVPPNSTEPVNIRLPWDMAQAQDTRKMEQQGVPMVIDTGVQQPIHPAPIEALPPKNGIN